MVTLAGLEPATSPAPGEQGRSIPPLSYSVVTIFMTVCGGAGAEEYLLLLYFDCAGGSPHIF